MMIWMSGEDNRGVFFNKAWLAFTGRTAEQELGDGWVEGLHPDDRGPCLAQCTEAFDARRPFTMEFRLRRADGCYRWMFEMATPRFGPDGRCLGFIGSCLDITERRHAEDALRESQERYALAVLGANDGIWDWNVLTGETYLSPRWKELLGYDEGDGPPDRADTFFSRLHPDDADRVQEALARHLADRSTYAIEHRLRTKGGEYRWFLSRGQALWNAEGRPLRMAGALSDITARKQVEEALRAREHELRVLADNVPAFFSYVDRSHRYRFVNKQYEQFFGRPAADIVGQRVVDVVGDVNFATVAPHLERALAGIGVSFEYPMQMDPDAERWMQVNYVPDRDDRGEVKGCFVLVVDVTSLKEAERALRRAEEFTRGVLNSLDAHICVLDGTGTTIATNEAWKKFAGRDEAPLLQRLAVGQSYFDVARRAIAAGDADAEGILAGVESVLSGERSSFSAEYPCHAAEEARWFLMQVSPLMGARGVVISIINIIERKRMELALEQSQSALKDKRDELEVLTGKLITAQEEERRRIARELHDDFNQRLAALAVGMETLERNRRLPRSGIGAELRGLREQLGALSDDLHDLAYKLHPSLLEHAGLEAAVRDHVGEFSRRTTIPVAFVAREVPSHVPLEIATCLFRLVQESLQNVFKHARATRAEVHLTGSPSGIALWVADDGGGFALADKRAKHKGLGLLSMEERVRLLKGLYRMESSPTKGTRLAAWIPWREPPA